MPTRACPSAHRPATPAKAATTRRTTCIPGLKQRSAAPSRSATCSAITVRSAATAQSPTRSCHRMSATGKSVATPTTARAVRRCSMPIGSAKGNRSRSFPPAASSCLPRRAPHQRRRGPSTTQRSSPLRPAHPITSLRTTYQSPARRWFARRLPARTSSAQRPSRSPTPHRPCRCTWQPARRAAGASQAINPGCRRHPRPAPGTT